MTTMRILPPTNAPHPADNEPVRIAATHKQRGYMVGLARAICAAYEALSTSPDLTLDEANEEIARMKVELDAFGDEATSLDAG